MDDSSHVGPEARPASAPRRRRGLLPQFGLRTLLVLGVAVSLFSAYVARNLYRERERGEALAELDGSHARISSDVEDFASWMPSADAPDGTTAWLKPGSLRRQAAVALGIVPSRDIRTVSFYYAPANWAGDDALDGLSKFRELEALHLYGTSFTDAGLAHLDESESLRRLTLHATAITPQGLADASCTSRLTHLKISPRMCEGELFAAAGQMPELRQLIVYRAIVRPEELAAFAPQKLERLDLVDVEFVPGADLSALGSLPNLRRAEFDFVRLNDADVAALAKSRSLEELRLIGAEITDASLQSLAELPKLRRLTVDDVVTLEAVAAFRARVPDCVLEYHPLIGAPVVYSPERE